MPTIAQTTWDGGELSPNLWGRVDLPKYLTGAALLLNYIVDYRGGFTNRPGTQFCGLTKFPTLPSRMIPFVIGQDNSYALETGDQYIRVWQGGVYTGTEIVTPYTTADIFNVKFAQSASVMTMTHPLYPPANLTNTSGTAFIYAPIAVGPLQAPPSGLTGHPPSTTDPDYCYCYVVTSVSLDGKNESLGCDPILVHYTIQDETMGFVIPLSWDAGVDPTSVYKVFKCGPFDDRSSTGPGTSWGFIGTTQVPTFVDINIAPDFTKQPNQWGDPFSPGQIQAISVVSGGSGYPSGPSWTGYIPLTITDSTGTDAAGFAVTSFAGVVTGVFLTNAGKNYTAPTITAGSGGATFTFTLSSVGTADPLYPAATGYVQQRSVFGGSTPKPDTVVLSQIADYTNFDFTPVTVATDAIVLDLASLQVNTVKSFAPVALGLVVFTSGNSYLLNGGGLNVPIEADTVQANAQAANGANDLPPIPINYDVIYMQNRGSIVRDLSFEWVRQSYTGTDISYTSNFLFTSYTFPDWAWAEEPNRLVWATRSDGNLLTMAFVPDQKVWAWSHHNTQGLFKSVAAVPEGPAQTIYTIVARYVEGEWANYVERFMPPCDEDILNSWYFDCALALATTAPEFPLSVSGPIGAASLTTSATLTTSNTVIVGGAIITITGGRAPNYTGTVLGTVDNCLIPWDPDGNPSPFPPGEWKVGTPSVTISGLGHLIGKSVMAFADGLVQGPFRVSPEGSITLPNPASVVVVGLTYTSQYQDLYLTTPQAVTEGKWKNIPVMTVRVLNSYGVLCGQSFDSLTALSGTGPASPYSILPPLATGDFRVPSGPAWNRGGQLCIQSSPGLPCNVLAIFKEVLFGSTLR